MTEQLQVVTSAFTSRQIITVTGCCTACYKLLKNVWYDPYRAWRNNYNCHKDSLTLVTVFYKRIVPGLFGPPCWQVGSSKLVGNLGGISHANTICWQRKTPLLQGVQFHQLLKIVNKLQQNFINMSDKINLSIVGLLKIVEKTCRKPVDIKFWQLTCNKSVENSHQTCNLQTVASHASAFW